MASVRAGQVACTVLIFFPRNLPHSYQCWAKVPWQISETSGLGQRSLPWACLEVATWFGRSGEFNNLVEARLCHLFSGAPGPQCVWGVHRGTGQDILDKIIEKETDQSKLFLESRWLGALHLISYSLIYSVTRTGKIPLRSPEPWP